MPRKTKKEKIIAAYRKKIKLLAQKQSITTPTTPALKQTISQIIQPLKTTPATQIDKTKAYFLSDLKKSIFLVGVIIALEILIYFVTINKYLLR